MAALEATLAAEESARTGKVVSIERLADASIGERK